MDAAAESIDRKIATPGKTRTDENPVFEELPLSRGPFYFGLILVFASLFLGVATYLILTGETAIEPTDNLVKWLLGANILLVLLLIAAISWQIFAVIRARARGAAGARLHVRLVAMFGLIAVVPAILVAIFASVTLDRGLDAWFSARTRAIIDGAQAVAESYIREHAQVIRGDIIAMGTDINRAIGLYRSDRDGFLRLLTQQARIRSLSAAFVIRDDGVVGAQAISNRNIRYSPPPAAAIAKVADGQVVVFEPGPDYMVRALYKLPDFERGLLYVFRRVDQKVVNHLARTRERRAEYDALAHARAGVQATFAFLYIGMALIFLLAAVWFGLWVANRLVAPIGRLINAARQVSAGDLSVTVDINQREGDIASLAQTFNKMIAELNSQRGELLAANTALEERRHFMEAVLSGVTAGVVGLDREGRVELINRSALDLLGLSSAKVIGEPLNEVVPEFSNLFNTARSRPGRPAEEQVSLVINGNERTVHARITSEANDNRHTVDNAAPVELPGDFVVTFDDITELQTAQRSSAWADIARRIAHEIKNPLTPIQLSAERLKRKYSKDIKTDRKIFEQCTDTIIRQVGDIGRMVDEFSSFARMPKAEFETGNLNQVVRDAVVLQKMSQANIEFDVNLPDTSVEFAFDRRLISQALTNLIKNASEAIEAIEYSDSKHGKIEVKVERLGQDRVAISVIDNGCGLPKKDRNRLTEPYMTTRENGTGLGLAIVRRIIEEHGGNIILKDAAPTAGGRRGAIVRLELPLREAGTAASPERAPARNSYSEPPEKNSVSQKPSENQFADPADPPVPAEALSVTPDQGPNTGESD